MKLSNGEAAVIEIAKIRDYCLSSEHPRGKHKARVFRSALQMTADDALELCTALAKAARDEEASLGSCDSYGSRYIIDFEIIHQDRTTAIRGCWIVRRGESVPRFVTCFVL